MLKPPVLPALPVAPSRSDGEITLRPSSTHHVSLLNGAVANSAVQFTSPHPAPKQLHLHRTTYSLGTLANPATLKQAPTTSPFLMVPLRTAPSSASGMEAAEVLP